MINGASGVFNILSNIYDGAFLWKYLTTKSRKLFSQLNSLRDFPQGPIYVTEHCVKIYIH